MKVNWEPAKDGVIPKCARQARMMKVWHRDGTICTSDDWNHEDLWKYESHGKGFKDIIYYTVI